MTIKNTPSKKVAAIILTSLAIVGIFYGFVALNNVLSTANPFIVDARTLGIIIFVDIFCCLLFYGVIMPGLKSNW